MKILKFIFIVLALQSVLFSCNEEKKYPMRIMDCCWIYTCCQGGFKSNSGLPFVEKYLENGTWYFAADAVLNDECKFSPNPSGSSWYFHSDTLSYHINGDILIRERKT